MREGVKAILAEGGNDEILENNKSSLFRFITLQKYISGPKKGSLADDQISGGFCKKYPCPGTTMVVQLPSLRVHLAMQGMQVRSLMGEQRSSMPLSN